MCNVMNKVLMNHRYFVHHITHNTEYSDELYALPTLRDVYCLDYETREYKLLFRHLVSYFIIVCCLSISRFNSLPKMNGNFILFPFYDRKLIKFFGTFHISAYKFIFFGQSLLKSKHQTVIYNINDLLDI